MTDPSDRYPQPNPAEVFADSINRRHEQLMYLLSGLEQGLDLIADFDQVNELLTTSPRPDLVMTQRVLMMPVESPSNLGYVNNFVPKLRAFGVRLYEDRRSDWTGEIESQEIGRRQLTDKERAQYFFMGARGGYDEHLAFAKQHGIDGSLAKEMWPQTHISKEAFMRLWILMPELTETLMDLSLDKPGSRYGNINEEVFVAYSLMSRLVDRNDRGAIQEDGTVDTWLLCH